MNEYEIMFIVHPDADEDGVAAVNERMSQWIGNQGGEVLKTNIWGRRRLLYAINKHTEGTYVVMDLQMAGSGLIELERSMKLDEQIIRHLVLRRSA